MQYDKNKNFSLILDPKPIKYPLELTKILHSLIAPIIKEGNCYDAWKFVASHFENGSSHVQGIDFDWYYSLVEHDDSFRINIYITDMHRITDRILDGSDATQNINFPINERVCVSPPPYYLDWLKKYYPNVPLNRYDGTFYLQLMNVIQGKKIRTTTTP